MFQPGDPVLITPRAVRARHRSGPQDRTPYPAVTLSVDPASGTGWFQSAGAAGPVSECVRLSQVRAQT